MNEVTFTGLKVSKRRSQTFFFLSQWKCFKNIWYFDIKEKYFQSKKEKVSLLNVRVIFFIFEKPKTLPCCMRVRVKG